MNQIFIPYDDWYIYRPDGTLSRVAYSNNVFQEGFKDYQIYFDEQGNLERYTVSYWKELDSGMGASYQNEYDNQNQPAHSDCTFSFPSEYEYTNQGKGITTYLDLDGNVIWIEERDYNAGSVKYYDGAGNECTEDERPALSFSYSWTSDAGWEANGEGLDDIDDILTAVLADGQTEIVAPVTIIATGTCGKDLTWTLDDTGKLTISGNGYMTNNSFCNESTYLDIKRVVIEDGVKNIINSAFRCEKSNPYGGTTVFNCRNLISVEIPSSITSLDHYVFRDCRSLSSVSLPEQMTYIGWGAFENCVSLENITLPQTIAKVKHFFT